MSGHLTREDLTAFFGRKVDPQLLLRVDRHLARCSDCQEKAFDIVGPIAPVTSVDLGRPLHLTYEEIAGFIDGRLSEKTRNAVELHLSFCSGCQREAADIQEFERKVAPQRENVKSEPATVRFLQWLRTILSTPVPGLVFAAAACMISGAVLIAPAMFQAIPGHASTGNASVSLHDLILLHTGSALSNLSLKVYAGTALISAGTICFLLYRTWRTARPKDSKIFTKEQE